MAASVVQTLGVRSVGAVTSLTSGAFTPASGNQLVVGWVTNRAAGETPGVVSSDISQAWAQDMPTEARQTRTRVSIATALQITGGSQSITLTPNVAAYCSFGIVEAAGTESAEETTSFSNSSPDAPSATATPGALAPTSAGDLYVAVGSDEGSGAVTTTGNASGEGWTLRYVSDDRANMPVYMQTLIGSGSKTGSFGIVNTTIFTACAAAYRATDVAAPLQHIDTEGMTAGRY